MFGTNRRQKGTEGERLAQQFLQKNGYRIIRMNEYTHWGEIDIIARDPTKTLVFIEVKAKGSLRFGTPEEAFHYRKQKKLKRAVEWYCMKNKISDRFRVDLIAIEFRGEQTKLRHYKNVSLV